MPESTPFASIIIPCYKMGRYLGEALASVGAQSCADWEVIVVDDCGPEDGTRETVAAFADRFPQHRVEFIRHEVNQGVSAARNTAIAAAKGNWLAFLDPDDYWLEQHLSNALGLIETQPQIDAVASPVEAFIESANGIEISLWELPTWKTSIFPASLAYHNFIQPSATLVRRECLDLVGGFDTAPTLQHIEDFDLWIRLAQAGVKFAFLPTTSCRYRKHPGGATHNPALLRQLYQELFKKHAAYMMYMQSRLLCIHADFIFNPPHGPLRRTILRIEHLVANPLKSILATFSRRFR